MSTTVAPGCSSRNVSGRTYANAGSLIGAGGEEREERVLHGPSRRLSLHTWYPDTEYVVGIKPGRAPSDGHVC